MQTRITVATQMFHGLLLIYKDRVVSHPAVFARQALRLADELLSSEVGVAPTKNSDQSPASRIQQADKDADWIVSQNEELLLHLRGRAINPCRTLGTPTVH